MVNLSGCHFQIFLLIFLRKRYFYALQINFSKFQTIKRLNFFNSHIDTNIFILHLKNSTQDQKYFDIDWFLLKTYNTIYNLNNY